MHPAFSVIFFTTLSGAGYGLWFWLALSLWLSPGGDTAIAAHLLGLALGFVLVSIGLVSSLGHLGKPLRAWRAFSQWQTSWLSREGVLAMLTYCPVVLLLFLVATRNPLLKTLGPALLIWLALGSLATVACTAMIYASLKPITAWRHRAVVPVYLLFSLLTGGILTSAWLAWFDEPINNIVGLAIVTGAVALLRFKRGYWRDIDHGKLPFSRAQALGLPAQRGVAVFERPHTEANYLTREMGFVLARKHSRKLRLMALMLFTVVPILCALPVWLFVHVDAAPWLSIAALSCLLGTGIERWLFFAEARHVVMTYY